jgi:hypothetical protein
LHAGSLQAVGEKSRKLVFVVHASHRTKILGSYALGNVAMVIADSSHPAHFMAAVKEFLGMNCAARAQEHKKTKP